MHTENLTGRRIAQYHLTELLGLGAMGAVYRARQMTLDRDVAIKLLPSLLAAQSDYAARFNREARIAAALEHSNIVPLHDYGYHDGISYVAMRLLSGGTLAQRLNQRAVEEGRLPSLGETTAMLHQVSSALDYAHRKGVIHRDIKPNNIMFDSEGNAYIVDFGIARLIDTTTGLTGSQQIFGTPHYMPPEQWRDEELTPETDQYALGVVIYSMITGEPPFDAPTPHALMYKHFHEEPQPPTDRRGDLPAALNEVMARVLAKTPADRYPTVAAFCEAFVAAIGGAEPESTGFFTFPVRTDLTPEPPLAFEAPIDIAPDAVYDDAPDHAQYPAPQPLFRRGADDRPEQAPDSAGRQAAAFSPRNGSAKSIEPLESLPPDNAPAEPVLPMPPPPYQAYPTGPGTPPPGPARAGRRGLPPVVIGMGLGLALLSVLVCGALAVIASRLGGQRQATEGVTSDAPALPAQDTANAMNDALELTPVTDAGPTRLPATPLELVDAVTQSGPVTNTAGGQAVATTALTLVPLTTQGATSLPPNPGNTTNNASAPDESLMGNVAEIVSLPHGTEPVRGAAFSPAGDLMATGAADGTVYLWSPGGDPVGQMNSGAGVIYALAFSPDGQTLVSAHEDATLRVWTVADRSPRATLTGHFAPVRDVVVSADGARMASASEDGTIRIWDLASGSAVQTLRTAGERALSVAFSADGAQIGAVGDNSLARVWDIATGQQVLALDTRNGTELRSIAFSPQGSEIATAAGDGRIYLWDRASGTPTGTLEGHSGTVWVIAYNRDGSMLVSGGQDNTARLWNARTREEMAVLRGHGGWVLSVNFSPDGSMVMTGSGDGTARIWNLATGLVVG